MAAGLVRRLSLNNNIQSLARDGKPPRARRSGFQITQGLMRELPWAGE